MLLLQILLAVYSLAFAYNLIALDFYCVRLQKKKKKEKGNNDNKNKAVFFFIGVAIICVSQTVRQINSLQSKFTLNLSQITFNFITFALPKGFHLNVT